jgi:hypothetical protein
VDEQCCEDRYMCSSNCGHAVSFGASSVSFGVRWCSMVSVFYAPRERRLGLRTHLGLWRRRLFLSNVGQGWVYWSESLKRVVIGNVSQIGFSSHSSTPPPSMETGQGSCGFLVYTLETPCLMNLGGLRSASSLGEKGDASPWMMNTGRGERVWEWWIGFDAYSAWPAPLIKIW